jgi:hypothetical protein
MSVLKGGQDGPELHIRAEAVCDRQNVESLTI